MPAEKSSYAATHITIGTCFGDLTVIGYLVPAPSDNRIRRTQYQCQCRCGKERHYFAEQLLYGNVVSCGTKSHDAQLKVAQRAVAVPPLAATAPEPHPQGQPLYLIWDDMRESCRRASHPAFAQIGGHGITLHPSWQNFLDFRRWAQRNGYQIGYYLHRTNRHAAFSPENCYWSSTP